MSESIQATCEMLMIVGMMIAAVAWIDDQPTELIWIVRIAATLVSAVPLAMLLKLSLRRDIARDHLQEVFGRYFNRDGFCFQFATDVVGGVCQFHAYYQSQYERPSIGRIALRPVVSDQLECATLKTIMLEIPCGPGDFGVLTLPIPLPIALQGKVQSFEVVASVEYPQGKGSRLRFRDGVLLRANTKFGNEFSTGLADASEIGEVFKSSVPATASILLPTEAAEKVLSNHQPSMTVLNRTGPPPINERRKVVE